MKIALGMAAEKRVTVTPRKQRVREIEAATRAVAHRAACATSCVSEKISKKSQDS
ncbi:hypothetical protein [Bradyrhizobium sp. STM 3557]|uniref:hypothetical protein n=1 Tax=Bradyrhizobium sp. STM 3557 TaxID=578920 RepID=UPI00388DB31F